MALEPKVLPETAPYWEGADNARLMLPRCNACCRAYFPPSPICPHCSSRDIAWIEASGRATLYSFTITEKPWPGWFAGDARSEPMSVAIVELAEGPRLLSTVVRCAQTPEGLALDMPLVAVWRPFGERPNMLCFRPAAVGDRGL
jgi:uncharacterized OB-fold protein